MCFLASGFGKKELNNIVKQGDEAEKNVPPQTSIVFIYRIPVAL